MGFTYTNRNFIFSIKRMVFPVPVIIFIAFGMAYSFCGGGYAASTQSKNMQLYISQKDSKNYTSRNHRLKSKMGKGKTSIALYFELASRYKNKGKMPKKALNVYMEAAQWHPANCELLRKTMYLLFELGEIERGLTYYHLLSKLECNNYNFTVEAFDSLANKISKSQLTEFLVIWLSINPDDTVLNTRLAKIYMSMRKWTLAEEVLQKLIKKYRGRTLAAEYYRDLGTCKYNLGEYEESLNYFKKAKNNGAEVPSLFMDTVQKKIDDQKSGGPGTPQ